MFPLLQDQFPLVQPSEIASFIIQFVSHLNFAKCSHIPLYNIISRRLEISYRTGYSDKIFL